MEKHVVFDRDGNKREFTQEPKCEILNDRTKVYYLDVEETLPDGRIIVTKYTR